MSTQARGRVSTRIFTSLLFGLSLVAVPSVRGDTASVARDAQTSFSQPNTKLGVLPLMTVRSTPTSAIHKSYAQFDLSALPDISTVDKAVLRLWVGAVLTPGTIEVVPVLGPWQEDTITANSSPALNAPTASFTVTSSDSLNYININITALVRD